ncbi:terminase small subunit [Geodermatophilus sp. SYSU D00700]
MTEQQPYTMSGLALAIGLSWQSLINYKNRDEFLDSISRAKQRCEASWEGRLDSRHDRGAAFNLTNNYDGWRKRQDLTGKDGESLGKGWADALTAAQRSSAVTTMAGLTLQQARAILKANAVYKQIPRKRCEDQLQQEIQDYQVEMHQQAGAGAGQDAVCVATTWTPPRPHERAAVGGVGLPVRQGMSYREPMFSSWRSADLRPRCGRRS